MDTERTASRRIGRPPRLTAAQVVDAAIAVVDEDGLEALAMSRVARSLGVGTMTLYSYVDSKEDLLERMAATLFADLDTPSGRGTAGLIEYLTSFRRVALAHPALAQLLAGGRVTIPAVFEHLESVISGLVDEGLSEGDAVSAFFAGLSYTIGFVVWEIPRSHLQSPDEYAAQWADLVGGLDTDLYPTLTGAVHHLGTVASEAQFRWGLDALLAGILARSAGA